MWNSCNTQNTPKQFTGDVTAPPRTEVSSLMRSTSKGPPLRNLCGSLVYKDWFKSNFLIYLLPSMLGWALPAPDSLHFNNNQRKAQQRQTQRSFPSTLKGKTGEGAECAGYYKQSLPLSGKAVEYSASGRREKPGWSGNQGAKGSYKSIPGAEPLQVFRAQRASSLLGEVMAREGDLDTKFHIHM